jgi:hypothetical protein
LGASRARFYVGAIRFWGLSGLRGSCYIQRMKKILAASLFLVMLASPAFAAQGHRHHHHHHHHSAAYHANHHS